MEDFMRPMKRFLALSCFGLALLGAGSGSAGAAISSAPEPTGTGHLTQCNGDYNYDPSNDPVHCHYAHPLPDRHWWRHHHHD
jgi:hypothetical protein